MNRMILLSSLKILPMRSLLCCILIVLGITATVVTNTLVMAVFERTREIGILAAIGMKGRGIMAQFLAEAALLATGGVIGGLIIGGVMVYFATVKGFYIGDYRHYGCAF